MKRVCKIIFPLALIAFPMVAHAGASSWTETPGGRVRVLIEDAAKAGEIRGALQIDLQPGWKTYWRNPGDSGVPPQINIDGAVKARIDFPAPEYFGSADEGGIGYTHPVSLPISFTADNDIKSLKGSAFLGVCEKICIPVLVEFDLSLAESEPSPENIATKTIIETAFDRLPSPATPSFRVESVSLNESELIFNLALPEHGVEPELFVASDEISLARAAPVPGKDGVFAAKFYGKVRSDAVIYYTLTQNGKSVSGTHRLD